MSVTHMGVCCREGCDEDINVVDNDKAAYVVDHDCKGRIYSTKKREYTDE